ncbi:hypothetical protein L484_006952 [Morus notabilis]|uniref:Uncharacterized protein n=1 Tax=Morus notabilis TaxID=981085 RepID=W9R2T5_9ROSA|nr:hypothetical protein L484_006952 [Morus notabilis]
MGVEGDVKPAFLVAPDPQCRSQICSKCHMPRAPIKPPSMRPECAVLWMLGTSLDLKASPKPKKTGDRVWELLPHRERCDWSGFALIGWREGKSGAVSKRHGRRRQARGDGREGDLKKI